MNGLSQINFLLTKYSLFHKPSRKDDLTLLLTLLQAGGGGGEGVSAHHVLQLGITFFLMIAMKLKFSTAP